MTTFGLVFRQIRPKGADHLIPRGELWFFVKKKLFSKYWKKIVCSVTCGKK